MKDIIQKFKALEKKDQLIFFLLCSTISNFCVGMIKFIFSLTIPSLWFFINAGFSFVLAICRLLTIRKYNKIKKAPEPLFVPEDNIEVCIPNLEVYLVNPTTLVMVIIEAIQWDKTRLVFYYKENAEKYIDDNKLIYSKKQIREAAESSFVRENYILDVPCCCADRFKEELFVKKLGL